MLLTIILAAILTVLIVSVLVVWRCQKHATTTMLVDAVGKQQRPTGATSVDQNYLCINLPTRRHKYARMKRDLAAQNIDVAVFDGTNGRELNVALYGLDLLTSSYKKHLQENPKQMGHLGATFSHVGVLQKISDERWGRTVVFEDDCVVHEHFDRDLQHCLEKLDALNTEWDILQLGFSCSYDSYTKCHLNDGVEIQSGCLVKLGYAIGLFGYVVNGVKAAQNILKHVFPISWHIDHFYQQLNQSNKIQLYATIPNLVFHPGKLEISSFNETYDTPVGRYVSDTNL